MSSLDRRSAVEVVDPGLLTTVQDAGRFGHGHLGVPESGPCDPWGFAQANGLVGNPLDSAALEATLAGPELHVLRETVIGIGGAELGAFVAEEYRDLPTGAAHLVRGGTTVRFRGPSRGHRTPAMRAYLAFAGGIDTPHVLGSRSTCLSGGFGGLGGRPLRAGDRLSVGAPGDRVAAGRVWPRALTAPTASDARDAYPVDAMATLRVVEGPQASAAGIDLFGRLVDATWEVGSDLDRRGVRLAPPVPARRDGRVDAWGRVVARDDDIVSQPMVRGAIQLPPDGHPIVLLADYQTVGGYPVPAVVIRADWPIAGQLAPGQAVRLELVSIEDAERAYREQVEGLDRALRAMDHTDPWDLLADAAGALRTLDR